MHRCSFTESSLTQLPNEYNIIYIYRMQVYCGRYIGAGGDDCLKTREVDIRRCKGADVKTQAAINFLNATTILIFLKLLLERQGSMY